MQLRLSLRDEGSVARRGSLVRHDGAALVMKMDERPAGADEQLSSWSRRDWPWRQPVLGLGAASRFDRGVHAISAFPIVFLPSADRGKLPAYGGQLNGVKLRTSTPCGWLSTVLGILFPPAGRFSHTRGGRLTCR